MAEEIGSDNLWLYANWGLNHKMHDQPQVAIEKYMQVLESPKQRGRNDRPRKWIFQHGGIFELLAKQNRAQEADKLFDQYAAEYPNHTCVRLEQAKFRLNFKEDAKGAVESYLLAKKNGCRKKTSLLSLAYYTIWSDLYRSTPDSAETKSALRKAETFSPDENELFYELARK